MTFLRAATIVSGLALAWSIVWAFGVSAFWPAVDRITAEPWGFVTLVDLYVGFFLSALVIAAFERRWRAALWIAPIPFLGNVWTAIWFVYRLPAIWKRLSPPSQS